MKKKETGLFLGLAGLSVIFAGCAYLFKKFSEIYFDASEIEE